MEILVMNGPNINMLGIREKHIYGDRDYDALIKYVEESAKELGVEVSFYQSNHEGDLVDEIQKAYGKIDGIVINPAAYTHTSVAIADALKAVSIPYVEVHISDVNVREEFRKISYVRDGAVACYAGYGFEGYRMGLLKLLGVEPAALKEAGKVADEAFLKFKDCIGIRLYKATIEKMKNGRAMDLYTLFLEFPSYNQDLIESVCDMLSSEVTGENEDGTYYDISTNVWTGDMNAEGERVLLWKRP